jgi:hypothetical protein
MSQEFQEEPTALEKVVLTQVMRMNATINGIVVGLVVGSGMLIATLWLVIKGGEVVGPHLGLLDQFFIGYSVTFGGSLVGFVYGFLVGFAIGYFIAFTYNTLADWREGWRARLAKAKQTGFASNAVDASPRDYTPLTPPLESAGANGKDAAHSVPHARG